MKDVILDTNFILTCVKQKIDLFEELKFMGLSPIIPKPVIKELEKIAEKDNRQHFREDAKLSLKILETARFRKTGLDGKTVDAGIIKLARADKYTVIATLDRRIKSLIHNQKLVIQDKKKIVLE